MAKITAVKSFIVQAPDLSVSISLLLTSGCSAVVQHLPYHPKVDGLNPATAVVTVGEKAEREESLLPRLQSFPIIQHSFYKNFLLKKNDIHSMNC